MTLNRRIRTIVNAQTETKVSTQRHVAINPFNLNPFTALVPDVVQGDAIDQRVGQEILVTGIEIEVRFLNVSAAAVGAIRGAVLSVSTDAPLLPTNPNDAIQTHEPFAVKTVQRRIIFPAAVGIGQDGVFTFKFKKRFPGAGRRMLYPATGPNVPSQSAYYLNFTCDLAATEVIGNGYTRVWYKDA